METKIRVTKKTGERYFVIVDVPADISKDTKKTFDFVCSWIDNNLIDIVEWE